MYFPELKDLKTKYNIPEEIMDTLDTWLAYLRKSQRKFILPEFYAREYAIPSQTAKELFFYAANLGVLQINYEIHCPYCDDMTDTDVHNIQNIPNEKVKCESCNKSFNPSLFHEKIIISFNLIKEPNKECKKKLME